MANALQDRINKFVSAEGEVVTSEDLYNLKCVIEELVKLRYNPTDGLPIDAILVNRQVNGPMHFLPVKYRHEVRSSGRQMLDQLYDILDLNIFNISVATREYETTHKMIVMEKNQLVHKKTPQTET